mgnify:CR=1 FL=1
MKEKSRSTFSGNIGFVLAAAGGKYLALPLSGSKGRRRTFSAGVSDTCSDLWLCIAYH